MSKCKLYIAKADAEKVNCATCDNWTGERCRKETKLKKMDRPKKRKKKKKAKAKMPYEETTAFKMYDRMMRENKGVMLD